MTNDAAESADGDAVTSTVEPTDDATRPEVPEAVPDVSTEGRDDSGDHTGADAPVEPAESADADAAAEGDGAADGDSAAHGVGAGSLAAALVDEAPTADDATDDTAASADEDATAVPEAGDEHATSEPAAQPLTHAEAHLLAPVVGTSPRPRPAAVTESSEPVDPSQAVLVARGLVKDFGGTHAVDEIDLTVPAGSFYGIVGPNGAGKTTTLSMISGLLRPDRGSITVAGIDARQRARAAKKLIGVLPDRFRTFDRLTGRQLLHYYGLLRGLKPAVVDKRTADLARAFDLTDALGRAVSDYSAGMTKKVMLAGAMIHSPRLLVLDEPFEAVDPVSAAVILEILSQYVAGGGTVILSSHTMDLVERVCSRVAVVVSGQVLAEGTVDEVRGDLTLEQRFVELSGGLTEVEGLEWLHTFSD